MPKTLREFLTTGQAARLCSVTPDTVLKWIKRGKLPAARTAGGHYRIARRDLRPFLAFPNPTEEAATPAPGPDPGRKASTPTPEPEVACWGFMAQGGDVSENCKACVVYRIRASRCFLLAGRLTLEGHSRVFCRGSCLECVYYRKVTDTLPQVLFITADPELAAKLEGYGDENFLVRIVRNGYEASAFLEHYRPAAIVVDTEGMPDGGWALLDAMAADLRISGVPVSVAVSPYSPLPPARRHPIVGGVIEKPQVLRDFSRIFRGGLAHRPFSGAPT